MSIIIPIKSRFWSVLVLILFFVPSLVQAQNEKDTIQDIIISAPKANQAQDLRNGFTAGQSRLDFDSTILNFYRTRSLADLIAEQSPVFVKSYGINSLSTLSIRGASAAQSQVLWHGIPINNAALGLADISLLNAGLFSKISLQYGGSSALFGSGNVGGALLLANKKPHFDNNKAMALSLGTGSFGRKNILLTGQWENKHWHVGLKAFYKTANNDFSYKDNAGNEQKMPHASMSGGGGILNTAYLFSNKHNSRIKRQVISLKTWWQEYDRQIPPALFELSSSKEQKNSSFRSLLSWKQKRLRSIYYAKISINKNFSSYQDGVVLPNNENQVRQWYVEAGWQWYINNPQKGHYWQQKLLFFMPVIYAFAKGKNLNEIETQLRPAITGAYQLYSNNGRYHVNLALRREWWQNKKAAWLPGLNARFKILNRHGIHHYFSFSLLANVQKSFRVPNLNELYFSPGGNANLKPEHGWNESGGISLRLNLDRNKINTNQYTWLLTHNSTFFNRKIKDWIYWLGGAIWTPHNLAEVHSRGIETETKITWQHQKTALSLALKTAYVLATTTQSYLPNDGSIGKQIPYTPRYNDIANIGFTWKRLFVNYNHHYTGYRFITTDESQWLKPYQTGNVQIMYSFPTKHFIFSVSGQIRNIWHERYEIVNGRPMPGRNFLITLKANWQK